MIEGISTTEHYYIVISDRVHREILFFLYGIKLAGDTKKIHARTLLPSVSEWGSGYTRTIIIVPGDTKKNPRQTTIA